MSDLENPTDIVEDILVTQEWGYQRMPKYEIAAEVEARWGIYRLQFFWQEEYEIFHLTCFMDFRIDENDSHEFYKLLAFLNERVLMGHFDRQCEGLPLPFYKCFNFRCQI